MAQGDNPLKFFIQPPADFFDLSEEEQLEWTRGVGERMAASLRDGDATEPTDEPDGQEPTEPPEQ